MNDAEARDALGDAQPLLQWLAMPSDMLLTSELEAAAQEHGLIGLFEHVRAGFLQRAHTLKAFALTDTLGKTLDEANVSHLFLKGATCAAWWSPPEARVQADVDLLLRREDFPRAIEALREAGVVHKLGAQRQHHHHSVLQTGAAGVRFVDLHHALSSTVPTTVRVEELLERRARCGFGKRTVWALSPEDAAVYLAVHCAVHTASRLTWLVDLLRLAQHTTLPWPLITAHAKAWNCSISVWFSWSLAQVLVGADVSGEALDGLGVSRWRRQALHRLWRERMKARGGQRRLLDMALRTALTPTRDVPSTLWERLRTRLEIDTAAPLKG